MNTHILLVESDICLSRLLESNLLASLECDIESAPKSQHRCHLSIAYSGMEGLIDARELQPDLILLSIDLPDFSGLEVCRRLRSTGNPVPLILLGKRHEIHDCVAGLDAGADDYISHPLSMEDLSARVRSRLRRITLEGESNRLQFEGLTLNRTTREIYYHRQPIELTAREFALLEYFMLHPQQVMTRDQILDNVWNDNPNIDSNVLDVYVRYLRVKLEQHHKQRLLHTVRGVGFVLRKALSQKVPSVKLARSAA